MLIFFEEKTAVAAVAPVEGGVSLAHAFVAEARTRNFIECPQPCQTDSVSDAHVGHVESNGSPAPVPQIDLIPGSMGLKQRNMIKSVSTSRCQMLPTLKFSSAGPLEGTQILARVLNSQFTYLPLHI